MNRKNIVLVDSEDTNWTGDFLLPFWVVFDGKYKFRLLVQRDKNVTVNVIEASVENDMGTLLEDRCYKFESYEVWANGRYYHKEETIIHNTDRLRFINLLVKGEGYARIIFEQISNDNKSLNSVGSVDLDEID